MSRILKESAEDCLTLTEWMMKLPPNIVCFALTTFLAASNRQPVITMHGFWEGMDKVRAELKDIGISEERLKLLDAPPPPRLIKPGQA